jgi:hypothetical protein
MNSNLKNFLQVALMRVRFRQSEVKRKIELASAANSETAKETSEIEYLRIVEELIREQNPNENSDHPTR